MVNWSGKKETYHRIEQMGKVIGDMDDDIKKFKEKYSVTDDNYFVRNRKNARTYLKSAQDELKKGL